MLPKNYILCNCFLFVEGDRRLSFVEREADQLPEFSVVCKKEEKNIYALASTTCTDVHLSSMS